MQASTQCRKCRGPGCRAYLKQLLHLNGLMHQRILRQRGQIFRVSLLGLGLEAALRTLQVRRQFVKTH